MDKTSNSMTENEKVSHGRLPDGTGLSSASPIEPVPVSPVPASIPSAEAIPGGWYCYESLGEMGDDGLIPVRGTCPYWESRPGERAYCRYLDYETAFERELLWDQVKVCGVRDQESDHAR